MITVQKRTLVAPEPRSDTRLGHLIWGPTIRPYFRPHDPHASCVHTHMETRARTHRRVMRVYTHGSAHTKMRAGAQAYTHSRAFFLFQPLSVHGWTSAFVLDVHRLCSAIEARLSHFQPRWLRAGWQSVISQGKIL